MQQTPTTLLRDHVMRLLDERNLNRRDLVDGPPDALYRFLRGDTDRFSFDLGVQVMSRLHIEVADVAADKDANADQANDRTAALDAVRVMDTTTLRLFTRWADEMHRGGMVADLMEIMDLAAGLNEGELSLLKGQTAVLAAHAGKK